MAGGHVAGGLTRKVMANLSGRQGDKNEPREGEGNVFRRFLDPSEEALLVEQIHAEGGRGGSEARGAPAGAVLTRPEERKIMSLKDLAEQKR
jgi:hypothetical protein